MMLALDWRPAFRLRLLLPTMCTRPRFRRNPIILNHAIDERGSDPLESPLLADVIRATGGMKGKCTCIGSLMGTACGWRVAGGGYWSSSGASIINLSSHTCQPAPSRCAVTGVGETLPRSLKISVANAATPCTYLDRVRVLEPDDLVSRFLAGDFVRVLKPCR